MVSSINHCTKASQTNERDSSELILQLQKDVDYSEAAEGQGFEVSHQAGPLQH